MKAIAMPQSGICVSHSHACRLSAIICAAVASVTRRRPRPGCGFNRPLALLGLAFGLFFAADVWALPEPVIEYRFYQVRVDRAEDILEATEAARPKDLPGGNKPGHTSWSIDYTFNSVRKYGINCQVSSYDIKTSCLITLPEYVGKDALLTARLKLYAERLRAHELGHCRIAAEQAGKFDKWLDSLRYYNCGEIMNSIRSQYEFFKREGELDNQRYDRETDYGRREGASLELFVPPALEDMNRSGADPGLEAAPDKSPPAGPKPSETTEPEPMNRYYKDKDGVWRNDGQ